MEGFLGKKIQLKNSNLSTVHYVLGTVLGARNKQGNKYVPFPSEAYSLGSEIFTAVFQKCNWCQHI